jgi:NAD(P)H-hydrate epimerase
MIRVVTPARMREIDAAATDLQALIERAGSAVAHVALDMLGGAYGRRVHVIAGPGNNGADGRMAADRLRARGVVVHVHDALALPVELGPADLVIDAAFGTGFHGEWRPPRIGAMPVLAVDVPTGLDGLTGAASANVLRADRTVTFDAAKPGHFIGDGPDVVGRLEVRSIGLPVNDEHPVFAVVEAADVAAWLPPRARRAHKWDDAVRVVAGSPGMTGAAHLVAAAAQRSGAGMVALSSPGIDADAPIEVVGRRIPPFDWSDAVLNDLYRFRSLVVGPGLGRGEHTIPSVVRTVLESLVPVVVDGDGLFALAWNDDGRPSFLLDREIPTVLTPHDGEFATLTGRRASADRLADVRHLVEMSGATVLLKGPTTVVCAPDGTTWLVDHGDERLATAGTGDVLTGIIAALLARGMQADRAAAAGAWIHAEAGHRAGRGGVVAGDLVGVLPGVFDDLSEISG